MLILRSFACIAAFCLAASPAFSGAFDYRPSKLAGKAASAGAGRQAAGDCTFVHSTSKMTLADGDLKHRDWFLNANLGPVAYVVPE
ncbi:hypothetical protein AB9K35_04375 [Leisingera sp. XS_AS12]|uniref:hypothetical protein n=1 Tax=Leisingera sp. XS_AS12 TaxID=3241294 RepID=UPI00351170A5